MWKDRGQADHPLLVNGRLTLPPPQSVLRRAHLGLLKIPFIKCLFKEKKNKITAKALWGSYIVCLVDPGLTCTQQTLEEPFVRNKRGECVLLPWCVVMNRALYLTSSWPVHFPFSWPIHSTSFFRHPLFQVTDALFCVSGACFLQAFRSVAYLAMVLCVMRYID